MKCLKVLLAALLLVVSTNVVYSMEAGDVSGAKRARDADKPMSIPDAKEELKKVLAEGVLPEIAEENLAMRKRDVVDYYTVERVFGFTEFDFEVLGIYRSGMKFFTGRNVGPKDVVVFDIDETVLSNYQLAEEENFESKRGTDSNYLFRVNQRCVGIKCMVEFCNTLRLLGYKAIFVSSRRGWMDGLTEATCANLAREKVLVDADDGLFLLEQRYSEGATKCSIADWKRLVRDGLRAKDYNIVCCIGDDDGDLAMPDEVGVHNVKLPNYLY